MVRPACLAALLTLLLPAVGAPVSPCPCQDRSLCRPLSPQPSQNRSEVVVFPRSLTGQYGATRSDWRQYDWSKVTTVVLYDNLGSASAGCHTFESPKGSQCSAFNPAPYPDFCCIDFEIMCAAHAHGARVLVVSGGIGGCNGGQPHNASAPCYDDPHMLNSQPIAWFAAQLKAGVTVPRSQLESWATQSAAWVVANGFDGALLDVEGIDATKGDKVFLDSITLGYCALKAALEKALPGSLLTWASAFTPYASGVVGVSLPKYGFADFHALGQCVDYFLPGAYCTCTGGPAPAGADLKAMQITEETLSRASAPMSVLEAIPTAYAAVGILPSQLVLNLPWFACDFSCVDADCNATKADPQLPPNVGGVSCGYSWSAYQPTLKDAPAGPDGGPGYVQTIRQLMPKMVAGSSSQYDRIRQTKSFRWHDGSATMHEVTYDDPETYKVKYNWAKQRGFKGLAFWGTDATNGDQEALEEMWGAVPPR